MRLVSFFGRSIAYISDNFFYETMFKLNNDTVEECLKGLSDRIQIGK